MKRKTTVTGLGVIGALLASLAAPLSAEAAVPLAARPDSAGAASMTGSFVSTISSPATGGCVEVPGGVADRNVYILNAECRTGLAQDFDFVPVPAVSGAYAIVNEASGMCMTQYRSQPRQTQGDCVPVPSTVVLNALWYLVPLTGSTATYELQPAYRNHGKCLTAGPTGVSFPTGGLIPNLREAVCNPADATQSFVITGAS